MRSSARALLALEVIAAASVMAAITLVAGLPLAVRHGLTPGALVLVVVAAAGVGSVVGTILLWRAVARPVERMLQVARALAPSGGLPVLGEDDGAGLSRASVLFARMVTELEEERRRLAAKVEELTRSNRALEDAREQLARSERLATMGRLAAGLAHEIGNPLGAVTGYVEVARARLPPEPHQDLRDALSRIADASARIDRTIRDLLDFARPAPARVGAVALAPVIATAVHLAQVQPRFRSVEVVLALPAELPAVRGEDHRLAQVFLNLLLNAGDAMEGVGRVEISARAEPGMVEVAITDSGPGIPAEDLPRLFEPFFTTKPAGEGTGLGLATSHRMVEELGGTLVAANDPRGGAVFRIRLALAAGDEGVPGGPC